MAVFFIAGYDGVEIYINELLICKISIRTDHVPILMIWIFLQAAINFDLASNSNVSYNKNGIDPSC